jgi:hypothetical protein
MLRTTLSQFVALMVEGPLVLLGLGVGGTEPTVEVPACVVAAAEGAGSRTFFFGGIVSIRVLMVDVDGI